MALLLMDGYDYYGTGQLALKGWTGGGMSMTTGTRFGVGQALVLGSDWFQYKTLPFNVGPSAFLGFALSFTSYGGNIVTLKDGANPHVSLALNGSQKIVVYYQSGNQILDYVPAIGVWNYWEVGVVFSSASGSIVVKINGAVIANITGIDTINPSSGNAYFNILQWGDNALQGMVTDDFYICDGSGSANNTFLGDVRVFGLMPDAAGSSTQWTPNGAGANYECVNAIPPGSAYISSSTAGQIDLYGMQTVPSALEIIGVQVSYLANKNDSGSRTIQSVIKSGSVEADGAANSLGSSQSYFSDVFYEDPNTSAAWTLAAVNAMQVGVEEVS
jgi:hypothetical protein